MYRFLLTPKWIGFHLLCLAVVVAMINLGFWQLRRLDEKRTFNAAVHAVADSSVEPYANVVTGTEAPAGRQYQPVEVTGTYRDRTFEVVNVSQDGVSGHDQVAALALDDGTLLLVNRGFTPGGQALPALPDGEVTVVGRLHNSQHASRGQTTDVGAQQLEQIRRLEVDVLAEQFDARVQPVYVEAILENGQPVQGLVPIAFPALDEGPHLSYAIQWFLFSACVIVGWILAVRHSLHKRQEQAGLRNPARQKALIPEQYL